MIKFFCFIVYVFKCKAIRGRGGKSDLSVTDKILGLTGKFYNPNRLAIREDFWGFHGSSYDSFRTNSLK